VDAPIESGVPFFDKLTPEESSALNALGARRSFSKGTTMFMEGDRSDRLALITEGRVKISFYTDDGREIVLAVRGHGELVGEQSVLDGEPRSATATALDKVEAILMTGDEFRTYLEAHPRVGLLLLATFSARLRDADQKRIEFGAFDTVGRVARRLVELADRFGESSEDGIRISLPLSQQELAGWTGASREAVSKALQLLRDRGVIETHRRGITVLDREGLSRRAT
jgi:CRP/FNR family cyclic AMP-dependent transcriptional regulator